MFQISKWAKPSFLLFFSAILGLVSCGYQPDVQILGGAGGFDFGRQAASTKTTKTFTVQNQGDDPVNLGEVTAAALGISAPFVLEDATTCTSNQALAPQVGSCTLVISFLPQEAATYQRNITLTFRKQESDSELETTSATLRAEGYVDCQLTPDHVACPEDMDLTFSGASERDFGTVNIFSRSQQTIIVTNRDADEPTILGEISESALGLATPFHLLPTTTCVSGMNLAAAGGTCELVIEFQPESEGVQRRDVQLRFNEPGNTLIEIARLPLRGEGRLDCSVAPNLAAARTQGVEEAQERMRQDAIRGRMEGEALTYPQGLTEGHRSTYDAAYRSAYDSAYRAAYDTAYALAYRTSRDAAYADAYQGRYTQLVNDTTICSRGDSDGRNRGRSDGASAGLHDGFEDGYPVGVPDGSDQGVTDGYYAAIRECEADGGTASSSASLRSLAQSAQRAGLLRSILPTDQQFVDACRQQGYNATYSATAYWSAFEAARAANREYQRGLTEGRANGIQDGQRDGRNRGQTEGTRDGNSEGIGRGRSDGTAQGIRDAETAAQPVIDRIYTGCYRDAYTASYQAEYNRSYRSGYEEGYDVGYDDGYADGYRYGWNSVSCTYPPGNGGGWNNNNGWNNGGTGGNDGGTGGGWNNNGGWNNGGASRYLTETKTKPSNAQTSTLRPGLPLFLERALDAESAKALLNNRNRYRGEWIRDVAKREAAQVLRHRRGAPSVRR